MNLYYFTFGFNHYSKQGICMGEFYVKVFADSFNNARLTFIEKFMAVYMNNDDDYYWQFSKDNFNPNLYPKGEALTIYQN